MRIFKKITAAFCAAAAAVSLSGCLNPVLSHIPYWSKDEMIEEALKHNNITWLQELLTDSSPKERAQYAFKIIDNGVN
ncbi:MAG: hypothetical protein K2G87_07835, partial [Oscillospiraceae bacterium]|nr:hypothetical protein [Oscillospiraceae bacterium]